MPTDLDAADRNSLMQDLHADRLLQQGVGKLHFQFRYQPLLFTLPARQQVATGIEYLGIGDFFGRSNHRKRFRSRTAVTKHNGSFHRVADRTGDQVQVMVGIDAQCQHTEKSQGNAHQANGDQGNTQMTTAQHRVQ
ncbi:hypothetical protein D3C76_1470060 [compost metagenome]